MVRRAVEEFKENTPSFGFALHGTPARNLNSIKKYGLIYIPSFTLIPKLTPFTEVPSREYLTRVIGSITEATDYGVKKEYGVKESTVPGIVILKGDKNLPFSISQLPTKRRIGTNKKLLTSFGNNQMIEYRGRYIEQIPPEYIASTVSVTQEEMNDLISKHGNNASAKAKVLLTLKVLKELKNLANAHAKEQKMQE